MNFVYGKKTGKIIGTLVNEELVPLQPAPTGDALDDLLHDVCDRIERHPRLGYKSKRGRMDSDLRPCRDQRSAMLMYGVHAFTLQDDGTPDPKFPSRYGGGVLAFIVDGTLRSASEIDTPLSEYADMKEERCRRHKPDTPPDWKFTVNDLWVVGKQFGLTGPPSREEIRAEEERLQLERQSKRERDAVLAKEFQEKYEAEQREQIASPEGQRLVRVGEIVESLVGPEEFKFHPKLLGLGISKEAQEQTDRWIRAQEIKTLRPIIDDLTKRTTYAPETLVRRWKQAEQDYKELIDTLPEETIMKLSPVEEFAYRETLSEYADKGAWEPWSLYGEPRRELESGETRLTFKTHSDLVAHMRAHPEHWWDAEKATVWMDDDRSFVMDYVPAAVIDGGAR